MKHEYPSDELVNAFVDGELDRGERLEILQLTEHDDALRTRICEIRNLKDLVVSAYADVSRDDDRGGRRNQRWLSGRSPAMAAAVVLLACGILIGRQFPALAAPDALVQHEAVQQDPVFLDASELHSLQEAITARGTVSNIMLHVETNDEKRIADTLTKIEDYLAKQSLGPLRTKIEIIANGRGLDLLSTSATPFEARISSLTDSEIVTVLACQRALSQLRSAGIEIDLIPEAEYASSALDWIIKRLQQGWVYVKV